MIKVSVLNAGNLLFHKERGKIAILSNNPLVKSRYIGIQVQVFRGNHSGLITGIKLFNVV